MHQRTSCLLLLITSAASLGVASGCQFKHDKIHASHVANHVNESELQIEQPNFESESIHSELTTMAPLAFDAPTEYVEMALADAIKFGLQNAEVISDVGGAILRSPSSTSTVYDVAIQETDSQTGVPSALAAHDAIFTTQLSANKNDRQLNNTFLGGGTRALQAETMVLHSELTKRTGTGTQFSLSQQIDYDASNAPGNEFESGWNSRVDLAVRHPWMLGGGTEFDRIVGRSNTIGIYNGVLVSRINTDISIADFESSVRTFVSDVEDSYWELYFAYRDLDAKIRARDAALDTWRSIKALNESNRRGGEAVRETEARDQLQRLEVEVQNALTGRLVEGSRSNNGALGNAFRASGGVHVAERRLRLLVGMPINDGRLIRPSDEPTLAKVDYIWEETLLDALTRRTEIRRQKWQVKQKQLEHQASRSFLKPKLDTYGKVTFRGFGNDLYDRPDTVNSSAAINKVIDGNHQELEMGVDLSFPLGFRQGNAAVRNAELQLARERAILARLERQITHDLSNAVANKSRAWNVAQTTLGSLEAAQERLVATQSAFDVGRATLDQLLAAQRRVADAETEFYRATVEYSFAIKNIELTKGTLLNYNGISLAEGSWQTAAIEEAVERRKLRRTMDLNNLIDSGPVVSHGASAIDHPLATFAGNASSQNVAQPFADLPAAIQGSRPEEAVPSLLEPIVDPMIAPSAEPFETPDLLPPPPGSVQRSKKTPHPVTASTDLGYEVEAMLKSESSVENVSFDQTSSLDNPFE